MESYRLWNESRMGNWIFFPITFDGKQWLSQICFKPWSGISWFPLISSSYIPGVQYFTLRKVLCGKFCCWKLKLWEQSLKRPSYQGVGHTRPPWLPRTSPQYRTSSCMLLKALLIISTTWTLLTRAIMQFWNACCKKRIELSGIVC